MRETLLRNLNLRTKILLIIILLNCGLIFSTLLIVNFITLKETNNTLQNDLNKTRTLFDNTLALGNVHQRGFY